MIGGNFKWHWHLSCITFNHFPTIYGQLPVHAGYGNADILPTVPVQTLGQEVKPK